MLHGQRFINPPAYVSQRSPTRSSTRGGKIVTAAAVTASCERPDGVRRHDREQSGEPAYDAVVLATGAWLGELARQFGVREPVQAGRGYSFSVTGDELPQTPGVLPAQRVACTPLPATARGCASPG